MPPVCSSPLPSLVGSTKRSCPAGVWGWRQCHCPRALGSSGTLHWGHLSSFCLYKTQTQTVKEKNRLVFATQPNENQLPSPLPLGTRAAGGRRSTSCPGMHCIHHCGCTGLSHGQLQKEIFTTDYFSEPSA